MPPVGDTPAGWQADGPWMAAISVHLAASTKPAKQSHDSGRAAHEEDGGQQSGQLPSAAGKLNDQRECD